MATIKCICGDSFSDGSIPNEFEYNLVPDVSVERLVADVQEIVVEGEDVDVRIGYKIMTSGPTVYKCPSCGRLLVFWDGIDTPSTSYAPESLDE